MDIPGKMFRRPRADETDEDLLEQEEALKSQGAFHPAAKVVQVNKRKSEEDQNTQKLPGEAETPRSKFARERTLKKKKEGIVDLTVLKEAVSKDSIAVLGRIIEREVPAEESLKAWCPEPSPYGFPQVPKLECLNSEHAALSASQTAGMKRPSLYKQQLMKKGVIKEKCPSSTATSAGKSFSSSTTSASALCDPRLSALGSETFIIKDKSIIQEDDAKRIHKENINKLASMSHEERLKEQQEILSNLTPEQLNFLKSLRKAKESAEKRKPIDAKTPFTQKTELKSHLMECETSETETNKNKVESSLTVSSSDDRIEKQKVRFSEDVEIKEIPGKVDELEKMGIPIPVSEAKRWLNMSKVEVAKLKALTDMPTPKPLKDSEGFVARFDFDGNILPYDKDVSHLEGLHHHGEEAGRAGYSLDEIFVFCRSKVLQQRNLGLHSLANILRNAKEGMYDTCVNPPVIQLAVEAGVVLILRFALDESSELVYKEAVRALYYLIANEPDEHCLSVAQPWIPGGLEPGISSDIHADNKAREELDKEEQELKDIEIIKLDVVRALMRMDTQSRLRYLLGITKPGPETVIHILGILARIARHSLTAAWKLYQTPHLISTIVENFLPHNLSPLLTGENVASMKSVYGVPLKHALHFLRVLAAKGRQLASVLVNTHDVMSQILTYVSVEPGEMSIPLQEALMLSQEAYALWATFLGYGLNKAQEAFTSFYPMLVKQLIFYRDKVPVNEDTEKNKFNYDMGSFMLSVMSRAVNIAASHSLLKHKMTLNQGTLVDAEGKSVVLPPPLLTWEDMNDFPALVETCLHKWLTQLARSCETTFSTLRLIGSCCHFLECYYSKWKDQVSYSGELCNGKIVNIYDNILAPFIESSSFRNLIKALVPHSVLISELKPGFTRDPINLGSLGCVTHGGKIIPIVQHMSPFPLLLPLTSLCLSFHSLHPVLDIKAITAVLESEELVLYLSKFCHSNHNLSGQWLSRIEIYFLFNILQLAALKGCNRLQLYHETAMLVLPCIHKGDEILIKDIVTSVICAPEFLNDLSEVNTHVDGLVLNDYVPLKSPALIQPVLSPLQLTNNILLSLKSIGSELVSCLVSKEEYDASAVLKNGIPFIINGLTISQTESAVVLDKYWPLIPIKHVFNKTRQEIPQNKDKLQKISSDQSSPEDILTVTRCLQMVYMGLKYRRKCLLLRASSLGWLQHLSLVFLVASDMFLDPNVSSYLQGCVVELLRNKGYANLEATNCLKGFNSCIAWFKEMLEQFTGVSYGDSTFALFLLIPIQQHWPIEYRLQLWGDMSDALPYIFLSPEQVAQFIPMEQFYQPAEDEEGLIIKYRSNLGSQTISERRNPFLFQVASHHVKCYLEK